MLLNPLEVVFVRSYKIVYIFNVNKGRNKKVCAKNTVDEQSGTLFHRFPRRSELQSLMTIKRLLQLPPLFGRSITSDFSSRDNQRLQSPGFQEMESTAFGDDETHGARPMMLLLTTWSRIIDSMTKPPSVTAAAASGTLRQPKNLRDPGGLQGGR